MHQSRGRTYFLCKARCFRDWVIGVLRREEHDGAIQSLFSFDLRSQRTDRSYGLDRSGTYREPTRLKKIAECNDHFEQPSQIAIISARIVWGEDNQLTNQTNLRNCCTFVPDQ